MRTLEHATDCVDVLIADDEVLVRDTVRFLLEQEGYTCAEAVDGCEAVELVRRHSPRCVLLDLNMPGLDGLSVARQLRADPRTRAAHIHCLTGLADPDNRQLATEAGCEAFLTKPVDPTTLLRVVRRAVKGSELTWMSGLTRTEAEDLLDWLEANGYPPAEVVLDSDGFAVRCAGVRIHREQCGCLRFCKAESHSL